MEQNTYGFIGLGLIGGSLAKALKRTDPSCRILAYTRTRATLEEALKAQAVDAARASVDDPQFATCSCIFLCAPVATCTPRRGAPWRCAHPVPAAAP